MSFLSRLFSPSGSVNLAPRTFVAEGDPEAPILDVRTAREYASGHLAGAVHVDVNGSDFQARIDALAADGTLDPERPVYLYCRSGNRSRRAARILRGKGFEEAYNIGGIQALNSAGAKLGR